MKLVYFQPPPQISIEQPPPFINSPLINSMECINRSRVLGLGAASYVSTTDDPSTVLKDHQIWEDGKFVVGDEGEPRGRP